MGKSWLRILKVLGLEVKTDKAGEGFGSNGFNVCAYLPGTIPGDPTIMCTYGYGDSGQWHQTACR